MSPREKEDNENLGSFYMGRMRPPIKQQRVMPRGALTVVALLSFACIIWYAYPQGQEKYAGADVPVIKADTAQYKFKPQDPGGMDVPHQDSTVFDPLENKSDATVEKLMPQPEDPITAATTAAVAASAEKSTPPIATPAAQLNLDRQLKQVSSGTEQVVPPKAPEPAKPVVKKAIPTKPVVKTAAKPAAVPAKPAPAKKAATASGTYVRVGSYRDPAGAKTDWAALEKKYPDYFGKLTMRLAKVDLPGKGIYYRLEAGSVSDARAKQICDALKTKNPGGCVIVK